MACCLLFFSGEPIEDDPKVRKRFIALGTNRCFDSE